MQQTNLQVTDKAVSRWEQGLGFPDINTIEPLADALELSVLELMKSERMNETPVFLPLFGAVSGIILIGYGVWRKIHHIHSKQIFMTALTCFVVAALLFVLAFILVMPGGFPVPN